MKKTTEKEIPQMNELKLDSETIKILENFAKIFPYFEKDDEPILKISNLTQSACAFYCPSNQVLESMKKFCTKDLGFFISAMSKFADSSIGFIEKECEYLDPVTREPVKYNTIEKFIFKSEGVNATFTMDEPSVVRPFKDGLMMVRDAKDFFNNADFQIFRFNISQDQIKKISDMAKLFKLGDLRIGMLDNKFQILAVNADDDSSDTFSMELTPEFNKNNEHKIILTSSILNYLLKGDYVVTVHNDGVISFRHTAIDLVYSFGENDKKYTTIWGR